MFFCNHCKDAHIKGGQLKAEEFIIVAQALLDTQAVELTDSDIAGIREDAKCTQCGSKSTYMILPLGQKS